MLKKKTKLKLH